MIEQITGEKTGGIVEQQDARTVDGRRDIKTIIGVVETINLTLKQFVEVTVDRGIGGKQTIAVACRETPTSKRLLAVFKIPYDKCEEMDDCGISKEQVLDRIMDGFRKMFADQIKQISS